MDKDEVYDTVVVPFIGSEEENEEDTDSYVGSNSMLKAVLLYLLIFLAVATLILILVLCKVYLLPKCCPCYQKTA